MISLKEKQGDFTGMLYLIVMISGFAIFLIIAGYIGVTIGTEVQNKINSSNEDINNSFQATINVSTYTLSSLWYVVFGGLLLGLFITAWFIPTHPVLVAPFVVLLIIAVIIGVALSNAYEAIHDVGTFSTIADSQSGINFIMSKLPYTALVIGIITLIITFAKPGRNETTIG